MLVLLASLSGLAKLAIFGQPKSIQGMVAFNLVEIVDSIEIFSFKLAFGGVHVLGVALMINFIID